MVKLSNGFVMFSVATYVYNTYKQVDYSVRGRCVIIRSSKTEGTKKNYNRFPLNPDQMKLVCVTCVVFVKSHNLLHSILCFGGVSTSVNRRVSF